MKKKIYKIMGVALLVVLLASLMVGLSVVPAGADPGKLKFSKLDLPVVENWTLPGSEGDYWATPGTNVGPIAISGDGVLFAALYVTVPELMKSTDGGHSWKMMSGFSAVADGTPIVDIVTSPNYEDDATVFIATEALVYQSLNAGLSWMAMSSIWSSQDITNLDVAADDSGGLTVMIGTAHETEYAGDVYVYSSKTLAWKEQKIKDHVGNTVDVLAVAFSPFFAYDKLVAAVVTNNQDDGSGVNGTTQVRFAVNPTTTADPAPWGEAYGTGRIWDAWDDGFKSARAQIAFPDDFHATGVGNNICFVGVYSGSPGEADELGDVYKVTLKEATFSSAADLNIRGATLPPTATNIVSLDVCGNAEDANILVGTDYWSVTSTPAYFLVYCSDDGGETWETPGAKSPTGDSGNARTQVLMSPDFLTSGVAYAATSGAGTSAFSRSKDSGRSWNQISLIDYGDENDGYVVNCLAVRDYNKTGMLHMVTWWEVGGDKHGAVWQRTSGGNWERIWSYANPGVTDDITELIINGDETMFAIDYAVPCMWRSSDMGATWPEKITTKPALSEVRIVSPTTIYTGHADGSFWYSTDSGTTWKKPEENPMTTLILFIAVKSGVILVSNIDGIHISSDGGKTLERVGGAGEPGVGICLAHWDLGFATNHIIFATVAGVPNAGVWRTEVDFADPGASEWQRIDDLQSPDPYDYTGVIATCPAIALPPAGVLYVTDGAPVVTGDVAGGLWRSTNPTADVDGARPPYFEKENKGLDDGDSIGLKDLDVFPLVLFCSVSNATTPVPYYEQIVMFTDTLDSGVPLKSPVDGATVAGLDEVETTVDVTLVWEEMAGATSYQWQIAIDSGFKSMADSGFTTSLVSDTLTLAPNKTYYWRVRVANEDAADNLIGAPLISPWSDTWSFTAVTTPVVVSINAPTDDVPENSGFAATVDISQVENFDAANYNVSFDASVLRLDNVIDGQIDTGKDTVVIPVDMWNEIGPGTYSIVQNVPGVPGVSGSGYLAVLHFHVIGTECQTSEINLSNGVLSDNLAQEVPATWTGDSVHVISLLPGDANGDGNINALDITKIERVIAGLDTETPGADANQDGNINALDITKIERIIAGLD